MKYIDMHVHTTASDGIYSPSQVIDLAIEKGLKGIAITDHDTVEGIGEAIEFAQTKEDFLMIPGIELSTEERGEEIHILGYMLDYRADKLSNILSTLQNQRILRARQITEKLRSLGATVTFEEVEAQAGEGIIGRPHIAKILVEKGFVKNTHEAFEAYLAKGRPAFVERFRLTPQEAIDLIKELGGYAVVAHPALIKGNEILHQLIHYGVDGIEVYHPDNHREATAAYLNLAQSHGLLVTGGSDFHQPPGLDSYHGDLGSKKVPIDTIASIL